VGLSIMPALTGGTMILMPVHILFLQLIIDPVCALVFEAEPLETQAMRRPPRPAQAPLFDRRLVALGLVLGGGLLGVVLLAHGLAMAWWGSESVARALSFSVLVVSSLLLIQRLRRTRAKLAPIQTWNPIWAGIVLLALALLAVTLMVPDVSAVFAFVLPPPGGLLLGTGLCGAAALWFRIVVSRMGSA
jgi:Ca2+-transporting ATPase